MTDNKHHVGNHIVIHLRKIASPRLCWQVTLISSYTSWNLFSMTGPPAVKSDETVNQIFLLHSFMIQSNEVRMSWYL